MLPSKKRVKKEMFPFVLKNGKIFHSKHISLKTNILKNTTKETKFSFVVSKKVSNKANKRNLIKRRGFSILREILDNIETGFICVFFLKKGVTDISYSELKEEILILLNKAKIIKQ
jgi:ribonuclease P protein component